MRSFGTCGCKRVIKPQRVHNDPRIWPCIACGEPVCDDCYHVHHAAKHPKSALPVPEPKL